VTEKIRVAWGYRVIWGQHVNQITLKARKHPGKSDGNHRLLGDQWAERG